MPCKTYYLTCKSSYLAGKRVYMAGRKDYMACRNSTCHAEKTFPDAVNLNPVQIPILAALAAWGAVEYSRSNYYASDVVI